MPFFARWDSEDNYLQIRITSRFIQQVAQLALSMNPDQLELLPEFKTRDPQLEALGMMLLTELKQGNTGSKLYIESLANVLAVHLLRNYAANKPVVTIYQGGLRERQVLPVLDYISVSDNKSIIGFTWVSVTFSKITFDIATNSDILGCDIVKFC